MSFLGFSTYKVLSSANTDSFYFILSNLPWLEPRLQCSKAAMTTDILCCSWSSGEHFQSHTIVYDVRFFRCLFSGWGNSLLFLVCWMYVSWKSDQFFQMLFPRFLRWLIFFFIQLIRYTIFECCITGINLSWSWCIILFVSFGLSFLSFEDSYMYIY